MFILTIFNGSGEITYKNILYNNDNNFFVFTHFIYENVSTIL